MILLTLEYSTAGPFGDNAVDAHRVLASEISLDPDMLWKVWTEDEDHGLAGGVCLFRSEEAATRFSVDFGRRLASWGITQTVFTQRAVNEALSRITHALEI